MGALAWEQEPPKTHSVSRPFFDRGVGSSILASLSEAGGNDQHSSLSKPLPPRSRTCVSRLSDCVHDVQLVHAMCQSFLLIPSQDFLFFVDVPAMRLAFSSPRRWKESCFGRALSRLGNRPFSPTKSAFVSLVNRTNSRQEASERISLLHLLDFGPYWVVRKCIGYIFRKQPR